MIDIKTIGVWGFEGSLRGCRMPYESFDKSDSITCANCPNTDKEGICINPKTNVICDGFIMGKADMTLCKKLIKGGSEHRKFLRMIHVQCEIRAPRYWLTELDTYKVGTVRNSSSTMHLITKRELTIDDFTADKYARFDLEHTIIPIINKHIRNYNEGIVNKSDAFCAIKQLLPESFMQRIIWDANYEVLLNIYHQRKNHRLSEWKQFRDWICTLPYMEEFIEASEKFDK